MPEGESEYRGPAASDAQKEYFSGLISDVERCYQIAEEARARGLDPEPTVEIPMAEDLAARVERLVGPNEVAPVIREFSKKYGNREEVSLRVAEKIARDKGFASREEALDQAVRTGLAILTEGVLVAPLEGIAEIKIRTQGASEYVDLYFAGPIRSAGGTGQALSVLIADVVRRALDIGPFHATTKEVERYKEEIPMYKRIQHLQYTPTPDEIDIMASGCPVCINGEGTEDEEVSGHRNLDRVDTNRIRGGACLVMAEGMCLKASKVQKHVKNLDIEGWDFIDDYLNKAKAGGGEDEDTAAAGGGGLNGGVNGDTDPDEELEAELEEMNALESFGPAASEKYIKEIIAGRPVFSHPSRPGGFRLRYGRARTAGLASLAIHPASMYLVNDFLAVGTQMKIERPGKATVATPCDMLEPPMVLLTDGTFREVSDHSEVPDLLDRIESIVDLGEILVPYGEFVENNHNLVQGAFSPEWWGLEARDVLGMPAPSPAAPGAGYGDGAGIGAADEAGDGAAVISRCAGDDPAGSLAASLFHHVPVHPRWNLFWHDISQVGFNRLRELVMDGGRLEYDPSAEPDRRYRLSLPGDDFIKDTLMELGALHRRGPGGEIVVERHALPLVGPLGLVPASAREGMTTEEGWREGWRSGGESSLVPATPPVAGDDGTPGPESKGSAGTEFAGTDTFRGTLGLLRTRSGLIVYPRAPVRIGTRMGRPEKAKERKMNPLVHVLFPIGKKGGPQRLVKKAATEKKMVVEAGTRVCPHCGSRGFAYRCPAEGCGTHTIAPEEPRVSEHEISVGDLLDAARETLGISTGEIPDMKGVQGLISKGKTPEPLEKGILRARHGVSIFKDGTVRYDMTDVPITHFRPREIGMSVERLRELGYTHDIEGRPLEFEGQMLELRVQDVVASRGFGEYMVGTAGFVDEMLRSFYGLQPFYNVASAEDLVGHLVIGLAPHTSGGVLGRLIGYTSAAVGFAHPFFHAAKRRNCDGDEDCLMLLLEGLLDFSRSYLPSSRGGQMDAPLVLSTRLDPNEIDKEAHNVDVGWSYPLEFYRAAQAGASPKDVEGFMETVGKRIGTAAQYEGLGYTHDTGDINLGPPVSAYKSLGTMVEKMNAQLALARQLRAVDESDVANKILTSHFLPDMQGNLRSFTKQGARCTKCNKKYRRVPLRGEGKCLNSSRDGVACGGNLVLTVHEGGVTKYLEVSKEIMTEFDIPQYTRQRVLLQEESIRSTFRNDKVKTPKLSDFL